MKIFEYKAKNESGESKYAELNALFESARSAKEIITQWLQKPNGSISIMSGFDDNYRHESVCFVPTIEKTEIAEIYVRLEEFGEEYRNTVPVHRYVRGVGSELQLELDEEKLDALSDKLGLSYHEDLAQRFGPFQVVYEYALGFALSDGGSVSISRVDTSVLFEESGIEDSNLGKLPLYFCAMSYNRASEPGGAGPGFTEHVYFQLNSSSLSCPDADRPSI